MSIFFIDAQQFHLTPAEFNTNSFYDVNYKEEEVETIGENLIWRFEIPVMEDDWLRWPETGGPMRFA